MKKYFLVFILRLTWSNLLKNYLILIIYCLLINFKLKCHQNIKLYIMDANNLKFYPLGIRKMH